jgi:hypothetical protein
MYFCHFFFLPEGCSVKQRKVLSFLYLHVLMFNDLQTAFLRCLFSTHSQLILTCVPFLQEFNVDGKIAQTLKKEKKNLTNKPFSCHYGNQTHSCHSSWGELLMSSVRMQPVNTSVVFRGR